jgi:hypothetical protein
MASLFLLTAVERDLAVLAIGGLRILQPEGTFDRRQGLTKPRYGADRDWQEALMIREHPSVRHQHRSAVQGHSEADFGAAKKG